MSSMRSNYDVFVPLRLPASVSSIAQSETWAVTSTGGKIQNDVHIDTYFCELIALRLVNITVFLTRFLSPTDQKCADSSTNWQVFYYRPPGRFL